MDAIDEIRKMYSGRSFTLTQAELENVLSAVFDGNVRLTVNTEHDYSGCYYEGDVPEISVEGFYINIK